MLLQLEVQLMSSPSVRTVTVDCSYICCIWLLHRCLRLALLKPPIPPLAPQAGFVHRDLRWENNACDIFRQRYFLLDLELCDHANNRPPFNLASWDSNTLVDGQYTQASDLHSLGQMLRDLLGGAILSAEGRSLVATLCRPASQHLYTVSQLLDSAWMQCKGEHCRVAGANPLEMP